MTLLETQTVLTLYDTLLGSALELSAKIREARRHGLVNPEEYLHCQQRIESVRAAISGPAAPAPAPAPSSDE